MNRSTPLMWPGRLLLAVATTAVILVVLPLAPAAAAAGATVSLSQSTALVDAQVITVTIEGPGGADVISVDVQGAICRIGPEYHTISDTSGFAGNCPDGTFERLSAGVSGPEAKAPWRRELRLEITAGSASWSARNPPQPFSLTCDSANACQLVSIVSVIASTGITTETVLTRLEYADELQATGCARRAPGTLNYAAPARLGATVSAWNKASCALPDSPGLPTSGTDLDELEGVANVAAGTRDLTYTGLGSQADSWFTPDPEAPARPTVATPVGLNAAVIAVGNGYRAPDGTIRPYENVSLTLDEISMLLNTNRDTTAFASLPDRPTSAVSADARQAITSGFYARHEASGMFPPRAGTPVWPHDGGNFPTCDVSPCASGLVLASQADTATWAMTRALTARLGAAWQVWDAQSGAPAGTRRGTSASIGLADPPFGLLSVFTGGLSSVRRRQLLQHTRLMRHDTTGLNAGPVWVLTDLASARAQGLTPVGIKLTPDSEPVFPTPASLAAATAGMQPDEQGVMVPNPAMAVEPGPAAPYPLTFVEHAVAPAEPLRTDDGAGGCTLRKDSQALLRDWLTLITSPGGQDLLGGLAPLTPALAQRAAEAIPRVGGSPAPPGCTPGPTGEPPGGPGDGGGGVDVTGSGGAGAGGAFGTGSFGGLSGTGTPGPGAFGEQATGAGAAAGGADPGAPGGPPDTTPAADESVPPFGGGPLSVPLVTASALGLMALLVTGAARLSSSAGSGGSGPVGEPEPIDAASEPIEIE